MNVRNKYYWSIFVMQGLLNNLNEILVICYIIILNENYILLKLNSNKIITLIIIIIIIMSKKNAPKKKDGDTGQENAE